MSRNNTLYMRVRAIAELISLLIPALFTIGCSSEEPTQSLAYSPEEYSDLNVVLKSADGDLPISHSDIFIFNNDALKRIDCYQRVEGGSGVKAASRTGEKIIVAIANSTVTRDEWSTISSYDSLMEEISLLSDDDPDYPVMSGQAEITATGSGECTLEMDRIMSKIEIRSLCADFAGTEFAEEPLTDVRIYLTNVNGSCTIMKDEGFWPEMIISQGSLDLAALEDFRSPDMLYQKLGYDIDASVVSTDISLYCYPNDASQETYGSPFTRLVIEGKISGITTYYPIPINREENGVAFGGDGLGVGRNCLYTYDITVCRFGTSDPDTPVSKGDVVITCSVMPWTEKDSQTIRY